MCLNCGFCECVQCQSHNHLYRTDTADQSPSITSDLEGHSFKTARSFRGFGLASPGILRFSLTLLCLATLWCLLAQMRWRGCMCITDDNEEAWCDHQKGSYPARKAGEGSGRACPRCTASEKMGRTHTGTVFTMQYTATRGGWGWKALFGAGETGQNRRWHGEGDLREGQVSGREWAGTKAGRGVWERRLRLRKQNCFLLKEKKSYCSLGRKDRVPFIQIIFNSGGIQIKSLCKQLITSSVLTYLQWRKSLLL